MSMAYVSTVLEPDVESVWAVLADFHGLAGWIGVIRECVAEDGQGPGAVGSIRRVTLEPDGRQARERLVSYDAVAHRYTYEFADEIPYPVRAYRGTVHLLPVTETGGTFLEWYGEFNADADREEPMRRAFCGVYTAFVADLRRHLTGD